jgi:hypothetical protein
MREFVRKAIALTRRYPILQRRKFLLGRDLDADRVPDVTWFGTSLSLPNWTDPELRTLCYQLDGGEEPSGGRDYLLFLILALPDPVWVSDAPRGVRPAPSASRQPGHPWRSGSFGLALVLRAHEISAAWDAPRLAPAIHRSRAPAPSPEPGSPCLVPPGSGSLTHTKAGRAFLIDKRHKRHRCHNPRCDGLP